MFVDDLVFFRLIIQPNTGLINSFNMFYRHNVVYCIYESNSMELQIHLYIMTYPDDIIVTALLCSTIYNTF